ncbi:hypothetical protein FEM33_05415 [Dyadobacter flavalbus]|uniref:Transporter n=1 Tax=Dyadobacter flavalbus TaxID=2579942 RepID=A0A5M8QZA0_9BACT|nr:hypothetical protein [Dyadobacter flavalbus]KAA6440044.1 hypothetical protein FEM33_05415 [Dyadobacter flavalbus]
MKQKFFFSLVFLFPLISFAQEAKFRLLPYINGTTSIKNGLIEAGPELNWQKPEKGKTFMLRPSIRLPLTDEAQNLLQIDRFTSEWRAIMAVQFTKDNTQESGSISRHSFGGQIEYGYTGFKYYPLGNTESQQKSGKTSYDLELKYVGFFSAGSSGAAQLSPQFRLRYAHDWTAAGETGVVNPANSNGVVTVSDMIIDPPGVASLFSPAFSLQIYPGKGSFSYSPAVYYDFTGKNDSDNPFGNLNRLRLESWVFFYPLLSDNSNVKIGVTPFLSVRTKGADQFNSVEYGGMVTIKFGTTFLQFL